MSLLSVAQQIQDSYVGTQIRESQWVFPILCVVHVLGLMIAGGTIAFFDLRLLGVGLKQTPVSEMARRLLPWTWTGFAVMSVTGVFLIWSEAARLYPNIWFRAKAVMLVLAGLNVLIFHRSVFRRVGEWDYAAVTPLQARVAGALSLSLWFGILAVGRAIGYSLD